MPGDLEAEILSRNNRVRTISFCNSAGNQEQIGPHFLEVFGFTTQNGIDYVHGRILDGRCGHYSMKDGSKAFGGPTKELSDMFEDIDGNAYKRVKEEGKVSLKDVGGRRYNAKSYGTIERDHSTPLESMGVVYRVTDDGEEGYLFNEKLCGGAKNGMNSKSKLVEAGGKVYLIAENKEGKKRVVDIETGEILFGDEPKCTGVEFVTIGEELCAQKTYGTGENAIVGLRAKNGENIYQGLVDTVKIGDWFEYSGVGALVRTYNRENWMVIVDRKGNPHFTGDDPVAAEAVDGRHEDGKPTKDGRHYINGKLYMKFIVEKPGSANPEPEIVYRDSKSRNRFGTPQDEEVEDSPERPNRITIEYFEKNMAGTEAKAKKAGILFKRRATERMFWMSDDNRDMFGGDHWDERKTIYWQYDLEGKLAELPLVLKHFYDHGIGDTVMDFVGKAYFENKESKIPTHHNEIRNFWVLCYEKEGEPRYALVLEAWDSAGIFKGIARGIGGLISGKGAKPSSFYLMDGTKFGSEKELKQHFGLDEKSALIDVKDFNNARVLSRKARDTQVIPLPEEDRSVNAMIARGELDGAPGAAAGQAPETITGESLEDTLKKAGDAAFAGDDSSAQEEKPKTSESGRLFEGIKEGGSGLESSWLGADEKKGEEEEEE